MRRIGNSAYWHYYFVIASDDAKAGARKTAKTRASPVQVTVPDETPGIDFELVRELTFHPCDDNGDLIIDDWELLRAIDGWAKNERRKGWPKNLDDCDWALIELIDLWAPGIPYDAEAIKYGDP